MIGIKKYGIRKKSMLLSLLSIMMFINVFAMKRLPLETKEGPVTKKLKKGPSQEEVNKKIKEQIDKLRENEIFLYNPKTGNGAIVDRNIVMISATIRNIINDFEMNGESKIEALPLHGFSSDVIDILLVNLIHYNTSKKILLSTPIHLSLNKFVEMMNLVAYLDLTSDIRNSFVSLFAHNITNMSFKEIEDNKKSLDYLNPDIKKEVIFSIVKPYVEGIEFFVMSNGTPVIEVPSEIPINFKNVLFNPNDDTVVYTYTDYNQYVIEALNVKNDNLLFSQEFQEAIVGVSVSNENSCVFATQGNNTSKFFVRTLIENSKIIYEKENNFKTESIKISPNGKFIAILHNGYIELWDLTHLEDVKHLQLQDEKSTAICFEFSPMSNHILVGCEGKQGSENLILYDISNISNIRHTYISSNDNKAKVFSVGWCLDGTRCFSISDKATNNFILWDFIDKQKLHQSSFDKQISGVTQCSISGDGKRLIVTELQQGNIVLWDLNNSNEPIKEIISKDPAEKFPSCIIISYDGTKIISFNVLAYKFFIWDIFNLHTIGLNVLNKNGFMKMPQNLQGKFACVGKDEPNQIVIGTLLNNEQSKFLEQFNLLNFSQAKLIRMIAEEKTKETSSSIENTIFFSLPPVIQRLLQAQSDELKDILEEYIKQTKNR
jgi:WD40 repeat protein